MLDNLVHGGAMALLFALEALGTIILGCLSIGILIGFVKLIKGDWSDDDE